MHRLQRARERDGERVHVLEQQVEAEVAQNAREHAQVGHIVPAPVLQPPCRAAGACDGRACAPQQHRRQAEAARPRA